MEPGSAANKERQRDTAVRRRLLLRLQADLQQLRADLTRVREETQVLLDLECVRSLSKEEAARSSALQRQAERLRWELRRLFAEFEEIHRQR